jgi:hypothetical protein
MELTFRHNTDGTTTGRNAQTGFTVTLDDEEEVKRRLYEDAGWEYPPPPPPVPPGHHRFSLVHEEFGATGFGDDRYAELRANPPAGCVPADWDCFALECERPGKTLLDAVTGTVAESRTWSGCSTRRVWTGRALGPPARSPAAPRPHRGPQRAPAATRVRGPEGPGPSPAVSCSRAATPVPAPSPGGAC